MTYTTQFDDLFRSAAAKYLADWNGQAWLWLKSEAIAESNLDPNVTAADGGMGIAQFMRPTWAEVCAELHWADPDGALPSAYDPSYAIPGMAYYLHTLWLQWSAPRPKFDRMQLTQASYNTGMGNMLRAQRLSGGKADFDSIIAQLPQVTGHDAAGITTRYVERIVQIYGALTEEK